MLLRHSSFFGDDNEYNDDGVKVGTYKDHFSTKVLKKMIDVNSTMMNQFLGIRNTSGDTFIPRDFNLVASCRLVYKNEKISTFVDKVNDFDVHTHIPHLMIVETLNPRVGSYANMKQDEMFWLSRIIENRPPNLGEFIVRRMIKAIGRYQKDKNNNGLPFGRLVSHLIENNRCVIPRAEECDTLDILEMIDK